MECTVYSKKPSLRVYHLQLSSRGSMTMETMRFIVVRKGLGQFHLDDAFIITWNRTTRNRYTDGYIEYHAVLK